MAQHPAPPGIEVGPRWREVAKLGIHEERLEEGLVEKGCNFDSELLQERIAIETRAHVTVVGELPRLDPLTPEALQAAATAMTGFAELDSYFS